MPVASLARVVAFLTAKFWIGGIYKSIAKRNTNAIGIKMIMTIHFIHFFADTFIPNIYYFMTILGVVYKSVYINNVKKGSFVYLIPQKIDIYSLSQI